jgi:hypothetical protein
VVWPTICFYDIAYSSLACYASNSIKDHLTRIILMSPGLGFGNSVVLRYALPGMLIGSRKMQR